MTDVVFFLKTMVRDSDRALAWPRDTRLIAIDPPASCMCGGIDPRCSSAYSCLWQSLRDPKTKQVMPNLLAKYAKGLSVDRVAFVSFSAPHGMVNPLANNDADRARISAYVLLDSTFGGGKTGYQKFALDAAAGKRLLVTTTSNTGGDESWRDFVWKPVVAASGKTPKQVEARAPMPEPSGGAWQLGSLLYYLRYVNAKNGTELPHTSMGKVQTAILDAYLVPYWSGRLGFPWSWLLGGAAAVGGAAWLYSRHKRARS